MRGAERLRPPDARLLAAAAERLHTTTNARIINSGEKPTRLEQRFNTHLCCRGACVSLSVCVRSPRKSVSNELRGAAGSLSSVSLPLRAGVERCVHVCACKHVWQSVRALSLAIVTRQGSPTEHAPTCTALVVGIETARKRLWSCVALFCSKRAHTHAHKYKDAHTRIRAKCRQVLLLRRPRGVFVL